MPLTADQLHHIEERLLEERARIVHDLGDFMNTAATDDLQERSADLSKVPTHPADLGTDTIGEEVEASLVTRRADELTEIDEALNRLASDPDNFGIDEQSGDEIPYARLEIIPWARTGVPSDARR